MWVLCFLMEFYFEPSLTAKNEFFVKPFAKVLWIVKGSQLQKGLPVGILSLMRKDFYIEPFCIVRGSWFLLKMFYSEPFSLAKEFCIDNFSRVLWIVFWRCSTGDHF